MRLEDMTRGQIEHLIRPMSLECFYETAEELGILPFKLMQYQLSLRIMFGAKDIPGREELLARKKADPCNTTIDDEILEAVKKWVKPLPEGHMPVKHPEYGVFALEQSEN